MKKNQGDMVDARLLTVQEVAAMHGVTDAAVYEAVKTGALSASRVLGVIAITQDAAQSYKPRSYRGREGSKPKGGRPKKEG